MTPVFKVRDTGHLIREGSRTAQVVVFIAPAPDQTFQRCGELALTAEESKALKAKLEGPAPAAEFSNDLTAEEYNRLQTFLMEWAEQDTEALYLADIVRKKFGASARRRTGDQRANGQG